MQEYIRWVLFIVVWMGLSFAHAETAYEGRAQVHDGDTLRIGKHSFRLWGIDAVELEQKCNGIPCGVLARDSLITLIGGDKVNCIPREKSYKRLVAMCFVRGQDLAGMMLRNGMAFEVKKFSNGSYSRDEYIAKAARLGVWAMDAQDPAAWRACQRKGGCAQDMTRAEFISGFTPMGGRIAPFDVAYNTDYKPRVAGSGIFAVNRAVNALPYREDRQKEQTLDIDDFWAHGGDCDKYALVKMLELRARGVRGMAYVVFKNGPKGDAHAVLAVPDNGVMLALDNRYTDPVPISILYRDYAPAYFIDVDSRVLWRAAGT